MTFLEVVCEVAGIDVALVAKIEAERLRIEYMDEVDLLVLIVREYFSSPVKQLNADLAFLVANAVVLEVLRVSLVVLVLRDEETSNCALLVIRQDDQIGGGDSP